VPASPQARIGVNDIADVFTNRQCRPRRQRPAAPLARSRPSAHSHDKRPRSERAHDRGELLGQGLVEDRIFLSWLRSAARRSGSSGPSAKVLGRLPGAMLASSRGRNGPRVPLRRPSPSLRAIRASAAPASPPPSEDGQSACQDLDEARRRALGRHRSRGRPFSLVIGNWPCQASAHAGASLHEGGELQRRNDAPTGNTPWLAAEPPEAALLRRR